mgnify:CR=1 FL=1
MSLTSPDLASVITSASARKVIYGVYVVGVVILGAVQVGFAASSAGQPEWVSIALAVAAFAGVPVSGLAYANTPKSTQDEEENPEANNA